MPEAAAHPQAPSARVASGADANAVSIAALEGAWVRNRELSEDAMDRLVAAFGAPADVPEPLRDFARSISAQRSGLHIRAGDGRIEIQNAAGEILRVPVDGRARADSRGNRTSAYLAGAALEVVTKGNGWLWLWRDTYYRSGDRLVQTSESQNLIVDLSFRTVYDYAEGEPPPAGPLGVQETASARQAALRIVPPPRKHREFLSGPVEVQALVLDPLIDTVEFLLDGRRVKQSTKPPFKATIRLGDPPREEALEVRGYRDGSRQLGADRIVLNGLNLPFAVRIADLRPAAGEDASAVRVEARVSVPAGAALAGVDFYRGDDRVAAFDRPDWRKRRDGSRTIGVEAPVGNISPGDFVRVAARLADGREREDAELLQSADYQSEIDVQLVQLQILAVDRDGNPLSDLQPGDFEIRENGERRWVESLHASDDVPLVLGIAMDSSESMRLVWRQLRTVVRRFVATALAADDRAFLVDFDDTVRLLQPLTGDRSLLAVRLNRLLAEGGTAINDGLLFSLLQFRREPGRRALILVTDGDDQHSRTRTAQVTDFAEQAGIPIYFIAVGWAEPPRGLVRKLSRRTGGRLFRVHPSLPPSETASALEHVFARIDGDLRRQHVLTYYSDRPVGAAIEPSVRALRDGLIVKSLLPLDRLD
ncbi:MAG: VWA domain-containing protein [Acidobacteriota bacterium]|nr:VWA domain-containing protein [Acidobacteriota bacterium]